MMKNLNQLAVTAHETAAKRGQIKANLNVTMLAHLMGEAAEAIEADKKNRFMDIDTFDLNCENYEQEFEAKVKNTFGDELADVIAWALIIAEENNMNIEKHLEAKMKYNSMRRD